AIREGAGATVTLAFLRETRVIIAHVGECRAYLIDAHASDCIQLTTDHIIMQRLMYLTPLMPEPEPIDLTPIPVLYRALGQTEELDIDVYNQQLNIGDRLLLCTDGLYRHVNDEEMTAIVLAENNLDTAAQKSLIWRMNAVAKTTSASSSSALREQS